MTTRILHVWVGGRSASEHLQAVQLASVVTSVPNSDP
jgi:hypothetical protein